MKKFNLKILVLIQITLVCFSCNKNQNKIEGIWVVESAVYNNETIPLLKQKMLFHFLPERFEVKKFNPNPHFILDSIVGGNYSLKENRFDSRLTSHSNNVKFKLFKNSLEILIDEIRIRLRKLPKLNDGQKLSKTKDILENKLVRFDQSEVYFEFYNDGTFLTSSIDPFGWVEKWSCTSFNNEIFFSIENSNIPLFQVASIASDSITLSSVNSENETWNLYLEKLLPKYEIDEIIGAWRISNTEFYKTDNSTSLDSFGFQERDFLNISNDFIEYSQGNSIYKKDWSLSKSGELLYFRNKNKPTEHIQWNIIDLKEDQLTFEQSVRAKLEIGTKKIIAIRK